MTTLPKLKERLTSEEIGDKDINLSQKIARLSSLLGSYQASRKQIMILIDSCIKVIEHNRKMFPTKRLARISILF